jgi:hypothetical protein|tara:strand:- start:356 stop:1165 length:810 start_codon:yes stop_codon:yes gene_type:complete
MAKIIDQERQETVEETTQEPVQEELTLDQAVVGEEPQQPQPEQAEELPEKYKNKSAQELVQMHQEAEKLLGRQSSEVGELRKVVDDYIQTQLTKETAPTQTVEEEVDFFTDPEKAVQKAIENHPKIKEAENINQEYRKTTALNQLKTRHPDMEQILQDPKFAEWIKASNIRTQLFVSADKEYNHEAADELFTLYKERQEAVTQTAVAEKQDRKQAIKSASTGSARGSSEASPKKIYRRQDIIRLMKNDPDRYASLSQEILKAYEEKRVR